MYNLKNISNINLCLTQKENEYENLTQDISFILNIYENSSPKIHTLKRGTYFIGRGEECDIIILNPSVSRKHAMIEITSDGSAFILDLGSSNKTFRNKTELRKRIMYEIIPGTLLKFGSVQSKLLENLSSPTFEDSGNLFNESVENIHSVKETQQYTLQDDLPNSNDIFGQLTNGTSENILELNNTISLHDNSQTTPAKPMYITSTPTHTMDVKYDVSEFNNNVSKIVEQDNILDDTEILERIDSEEENSNFGNNNEVKANKISGITEFDKEQDEDVDYLSETDSENANKLETSLFEKNKSYDFEIGQDKERSDSDDGFLNFFSSEEAHVESKTLIKPYKSIEIEEAEGILDESIDLQRNNNNLNLSLEELNKDELKLSIGMKDKYNSDKEMEVINRNVDRSIGNIKFHENLLQPIEISNNKTMFMSTSNSDRDNSDENKENVNFNKSFSCMNTDKTSPEKRKKNTNSVIICKKDKPVKYDSKKEEESNLNYRIKETESETIEAQLILKKIEENLDLDSATQVVSSYKSNNQTLKIDNDELMYEAATQLLSRQNIESVECTQVIGITENWLFTQMTCQTQMATQVLVHQPELNNFPMIEAAEPDLFSKPMPMIKNVPGILFGEMTSNEITTYDSEKKSNSNKKSKKGKRNSSVTRKKKNITKIIDKIGKNTEEIEDTDKQNYGDNIVIKNIYEKETEVKSGKGSSNKLQVSKENENESKNKKEKPNKNNALVTTKMKDEKQENENQWDMYNFTYNNDDFLEINLLNGVSVNTKTKPEIESTSIKQIGKKGKSKKSNSVLTNRVDIDDDSKEVDKIQPEKNSVKSEKISVKSERESVELEMKNSEYSSDIDSNKPRKRGRPRRTTYENSIVSIETETDDQKSSGNQSLKRRKLNQPNSTVHSVKVEPVSKRNVRNTSKFQQIESKEAHLSSRSENLDKVKVHRVMFTGITVNPALSELVDGLGDGSEIINDVTQTTVLITDQVRRTVKFLCCLARGVPIVTLQWLKACGKSNCVLDTEPYTVKKNSFAFKVNIPNSLALAREYQESVGGILAHYRCIVFITENTNPNSIQLKQMVDCAGGKILSITDVSFYEHLCDTESRRFCITDPSSARSNTRDMSNRFRALVENNIDILSVEFILALLMNQKWPCPDQYRIDLDIS